MDYREVNRLIEEGEGIEIEFKRKVSIPAKIARVLIAFANTKGGRILFGVDDNGSIVGVESEKSEVDLIRHAGLMFCLPEIEPFIDIVAFNRKDVIVAHVEESEQKPHFFTGRRNGHSEAGEDAKIFIRVNDKTVIASWGRSYSYFLARRLFPLAHDVEE